MFMMGGFSWIGWWVGVFELLRFSVVLYSFLSMVQVGIGYGLMILGERETEREREKEREAAGKSGIEVCLVLEEEPAWDVGCGNGRKKNV
jgi:hypothetical protein